MNRSDLICAIFFTYAVISINSQPLNTTINQPNQHNSDNESPVKRCNTGFKLHTVKFIWILDNFSIHATGMNLIISPSFSAETCDKVEWHLEATPGDSFSYINKFYMNLGIFPKFYTTQGIERIVADVDISMLVNRNKTVWHYNAKTQAFDTRGMKWRYIKLVEDDFVSNDELIISCNIAFYECIHNVHHQPNTTQHQLKSSTFDLQENLAPLLENREVTDVVLAVRGKEYPAHKLILAARSPFFASIFKNNTEQGKKVKRIDITDTYVDEQIAGEMLRYIYAGYCENLEKLAYGLLLAANKYDLEGLKIICVEMLRKNLTVENAPKTLMYADQHQLNELKSKTIHFIADHYIEMSNTTGWKNIVDTRPQIVHEVCQVFSYKLGDSKAAKKICS